MHWISNTYVTIGNAIFESVVYTLCCSYVKARVGYYCPDCSRLVTLSCTIGLLWTKQFYHYVMDTWVEGDPTQPPPPDSREWGRNAQDWEHLYNRDVVSMPDKWEYPWVNFMQYIGYNRMNGQTSK